MINSDSTSQIQGEDLICHWNECLRAFPNHDALSHHLSEEHIGWKRGEYCCEWTRCSRKGVKCHNRFALIMHLRIHTQEKPFECDVDVCGMNFGRLDALTRHKKVEHGIDTQGNTGKVTTLMTPDNTSSTTIKIESPQSQYRKRNTIQMDDLHKLTTSQGLTKKRKLAREEDHTDKHKRGRLDNGRRQQHDSDIGDYGGVDLHVTNSAIATHISQQQRHSHTALPSSASLSPQNKYKIAKAKLQYILRENEMLNDEWTSIQRRLTRLQTERRVLLDALMTTEDDEDGDLLSSDGDDDDDPMDALASNDKQDDAMIKERDSPLGTQSSVTTSGIAHQNHNGYVV